MKHAALARGRFTRLVFALTLAVAAFVVTRARTDEWIHAMPSSVVPHQLSAFTCDGVTSVNVRWIFYSSGYRVVQPPVVSRAGQTITLDVRAEEFTGGILPALFNFDKNFELGALEPGAYTLDVTSWGAALKQIQFNVRQTPPASAPLDGGCFFVAQHYRDFLSRDADGAGLAFWTDEINKCGTDSACIEVKRINVSAAFFLSIEFQNTGGYVYLIYKTAFGRAPTFAEFAPAAAFVGSRVVVGSDDPWELRLNGNKDIFAQGIYARQDFTERYNGLTTAQYVDKLFETAGVTPTQAEREEMISSVDTCHALGCPTRVTLLRRVAEHPALDRKLFNESFVTMQYFGYLRRDPDPDGLNFWLTKLNHFNGNFVAAEMVKAFITSDEYRHRFGQ
jgi:hypothetical protein